MSLVIGGLTIRLIASLAKLFFNVYLLNAAVRDGRKINSEILSLGKIATIGGGIIVVVIVFGQTHQMNVVGLVASLGIGGAAIAFAAQKTLEQLLGIIVLYLDRPFVPGDHIRVSLNPHAKDVYGQGCFILNFRFFASMRIRSFRLHGSKVRCLKRTKLVA